MTDGAVTIGATGEVVARLHAALVARGLAIPAAERDRRLFGPATEDAVRKWQARVRLPRSGAVDARTAATLGVDIERPEDPTTPLPGELPAEFKFLVRGQVMFERGLPIEGATVRAFHKRLRRDDLLGSSTTDANGRFDVYYGVDDLDGTNGRHADLVVRAFDDGDEVIATSTVIYGARRVEKVRLLVDGGPETTWSEYEQLLSEVNPLLDGVSIAALGESPDRRDVSLLAGKTGQDPRRVADLVIAHKLSDRTGIRPEIYYGLARANLSSALTELLAEGPAVQRRALRAAAEKLVVPGRVEKEVDLVQEALREEAVRLLLERETTDGRPTLGAVAATVLPSGVRPRFMSAFVAHRGSIRAFWDALRSDERLQRHVDGLQQAFQFAALSGNHLPLVKELQRMRDADEVGSFRELARFGVDEWKEIVQRTDSGADVAPPTIEGATTEERATLYAQTLTRIVSDVLPTYVLAYRAQADEALPGVRRFWRNVTDSDDSFELAGTRLGDYVEQHPELLAGVADPQPVMARVTAMQRIYRVTSGYEQLSAIMDAGLDSALALAAFGQGVFVKRFGDALGGEAEAMVVYEKAAHVAATSLALFTSYSPIVNNVSMRVLPAPSSKDVPNLETLFGSLDLCACAECRSIYSAAAYLGELLAFLGDRPQTIDLGGGQTLETDARAILLDRRPDLGEIELSCANTNTRLPYVDLVNEVLENAVAPFAPLVLPGGLATDLDARDLSANVRAAFAADGVVLGDDHFVVVVEAGERWFVTDHARLYPVAKDAATGQLRVPLVAYQTRASAGELAANPEHENPDAYEVLRAAVFPASLPLDLWWEEVRTYLRHLRVERYELMREVAPREDAAALTDVDVATEYLGLTSLERELASGGLRVRLASTADVAPPAGTPTIDGIATAAGDVVLLKNQADPTQDGLYTIDAAAWERIDRRGSHLVTAAEGAVNAGRSWLARPAADGGTAVQRLQPWDFWGLTQDGNLVEVFDPAQPEAPVTQPLGWLQALRWVHVLLTRTELDYDELLEVLATRFVSPQGTIRIESADPNDPTTCDVAKLVVTNLDAAAVARIRRFLRLQRRLGWTTWELDEAIATLAAGVADPNERIDDDLIVKLSHVQRLRAELGLPVEQLLAFWAPIGHAGPDSLYARLFLDPTLVKPVDPAFALDGDELAIVAADPAEAKLSKHAPAIVAALGVSANDLAELAAALAPDDALTLANLSELYRHARLAAALDLSTADFLTLTAMAEIDPFQAARTEAAVQLVELVAQVRASRFGIAELDYLLHHRVPEGVAPGVGEAATAQALGELRAGLRKVQDDTALVPDPVGDETRKRLAALAWPTAIIDRVVETLDGSARFETSLAALPSPLAIPAALTGRVSYDDSANLLRVRGPLSLAEWNDLRNASNDAAFQAAVDELRDAPRRLVSERMKAFEWPTFSEGLAAMPPGVAIPQELRNRAYYDAPGARLSFVGLMTDSDKAALEALSPDAAYRAAVQALYDAPAAFAPAPDNAFFTAVDAAALFDAPPTPEERFQLVLDRVLSHLRTSASRLLTVQTLAELLTLPTRMAALLLEEHLPSLSSPGEPAMADFLAPAFAESDPQVALTAADFPDQFKTVVRLDKAALLIRRLRLSTAQIEWLSEFGPDVPLRSVPWIGAAVQAGWLSLDALPADETPRSGERFFAWLRVVELARARGTLPGGDDALGELFALAREPGIGQATLLQRLSELSGWDATELEFLAGPDGLALSLPADLRDESGVLRLRTCFLRMRRVGASAAQCRAWTAPQPSQDDARAAKQAVKAKYADAEWLELAKPLRDTLRERQRQALVAYLVAKEDAWENAADLYRHFLIDVEMDPCMTTSRIKQAIGSVQLFVQRCLLNLEPQVTADETSDPGWAQWRWMKSYRVWEANRKVFLYPENWVDPELRDDKSPLFRDLENALQQGDVTADAAEDALHAYLLELDTVARLEVVGMYVEAATPGTPEVIHLIGRTQGDPPHHYYRTLTGGTRWSPWERIDLDIGEPQVVPVVWNRRLYLFWPVFTEAATQTIPTSNQPQDPERYLDIQVAWSERRRGKWMPKKVTTQKIRSDLKPVDGLADKGKSRHVFRVALEGAGLKIWYEYDDPKTKVSIPTSPYYGGGSQTINAAYVTGFHFTGCDGKIAIFTTLATGIFQPTGTKVDGMLFTELSAAPLNLPKGGSEVGEDVALQVTPGTFSLLYAHQDAYLTGQRPFFFQDARHTYYVVPEEVTVYDRLWRDPNLLDPYVVDHIDDIYYRARSPINPAGPALEAPPATFAERALAAATARRGAGIDPDEKWVVSKGDRRLLSLSDYVDDERLFTSSRVVLVPRRVNRYRFHAFYHAYACSFIKELNRGGTQALLRRAMQLESAKPFKDRYAPTSMVVRGDAATEDKYPLEDVDFSYGGAYAPYNWELFFHAPLLIALRLSQNQRFEEAQRWFHAIFDPTDTGDTVTPRRYWRTRPFYEQTDPDYLQQRIDRLLELLAKGEPDPDLAQQVSEWYRNPFNPHAIARLRIVAYQRSVVMRYLDNLIAWGDQLFRRDTIESINEATQLYVLAAEILGPRPPAIAPRVEPQVQTANSLGPQVEALGNKLVEIEDLVASPRPDAVVSSPDDPPLPLPKLLYFCLPPNDRLLSYWDTVADRLFKIRHCMSIEGVVRQLPLFDPPIDPELLVRAAAAGVDLTSAMNDIAAPLPSYRFATLSQKATELCLDLKALGAALLSALEKRDAEELSLIRARHEIDVLEAVEEIKQQEVRELTQQIAALRRSRDVAIARLVHYQRLLGVQDPKVPAEGESAEEQSPSSNATIQTEQGIRMLDHERNELRKMEESSEERSAAIGWEIAANVSYYVPQFKVTGEPWGVGVAAEFGGQHIGPALMAVANWHRSKAEKAQREGARSGRLAEFIVREHDWVLQSNLAAREIATVDAQIVALQIREQAAVAELEIHRAQMEQGREVEDFMRTKYTNHELYTWMVTQTAGVYFQGYQLAYDVGKRAERAFRFELGLQDSSFVQFGYWDSLRKGLLAGERLHQDVKRMEAAYLERNKREYEITKHVSLASLHPEALVELRETGSCFVDLPEAIFDLDHPGHYLRRIKSVGVTIPCTTGPYTSVGCTVTLLSSRTRVDTRVTPGYPWTGPDDQRFVYNLGAIQSIVTSSARDDAGVFQLDLRDERYLPFEGAGVLSSWRIELPSEFRQFDYSTITDVVFHVRYSARDGGAPLRDAAVDSLTQALKEMEVEEGTSGLFRLFSARHEFPDAWHRFLHQPVAAPQEPLQLAVTPERFPMHLQDHDLKVGSLALYARVAKAVEYDDADPLGVLVEAPNGTQRQVTLERIETELGGLPAGVADFGAAGVALSDEVPWLVSITHLPDVLSEEVEVEGAPVERLDSKLLVDLGVVVSYTF